MEVLTKLWDFLNGNKTLIGTFGLLILEQDFTADWNVGVVNILTWAFVAIGGTGAGHKLRKALKKK
jgi:hypothetical protein